MHLHGFAVCVLLFAVANAAMLVLAVNALAARHESNGFTVSGAILVSQLVAAALSPALGRAAERHGRRPILLLGFAALPLRGLLLAVVPGSWPLVAVQALDGVSGAVMGIMIPLIAADLTRRTAFLNLAINSLALASGLGATVSTLAGGWLADRLGVTPALLCLAAIGLLATALVWRILPETRPHQQPAQPTAAVDLP
jgi:MFS family permease